MPPDLLIHTVAVVRAGTATDRYGNTVPDWDNPSSSTDVAAWMQQDARSEVTDQRDAQVGDWLMMCDPADITGSDRVHWQGLMFEVIGPPAPLYTPQELHHLEVRLRVVEG